MSKDFATVVCQVLEIVREEKSINDVLVMAKLGFTPDNWRHWRYKIIELFTISSYPKEDSEDKSSKETVVYDKKLKLWTIQDL